MVVIPGYESGPLAEGADFLDEPLFWPGHLGSSLPAGEAQALAFGADRDAAREVYRNVMDPVRWPVFRVELTSGHVIHVVYRNLDGDMGVDYLVVAPGAREAVTLACDEGSFMGPGLSWPELEAVAGQSATEGVVDPDARLLLLFPMLGDADVPEHAASRLASALAALTVVERPEELAPLLLRQQGQWQAPNWSQDDGTWVCDGAHSVRNPVNPFALPAPRLVELGAALNER
ncbi:hypothetical protein ACQB60_22520 [Actinomycetota bacterium Odt1-20B]